MATKDRDIGDKGQEDADRSDRERAKSVQLDPEAEAGGGRDRPAPSDAPAGRRGPRRPEAPMSDD